MHYIDRGDYVPEPEPAKPKREVKPRQKNDPKLVSAARELRDRYLEQINTSPLLPTGKYDVSRALAAPPGHDDSAILPPARQLPSAA